MSYKDALMNLRQSVFNDQISVPDTKPKSTFIPMRTAPLQEAPDTKDEHWLNSIKRKAAEIKSKAPAEEKGNFATGFAEGLNNKVAENQQKKIAATPESREALIERRRGHLPSASAPMASRIPVDAEMPAVLEALAAVESRGSGDYRAKGPIVEKGAYKGQRAIGRYQVMEGNIPSWTKEALGTSMTPEEFLNDDRAQDAVAAYQLQRSKDKHGTWEDAASVWFSGRPMKTAGEASDGYTTVPEYITKFQKYFKG